MHLALGGWVECPEFMFHPTFEDGSDSTLREWQSNMIAGALELGIDLKAGIRRWPIGEWSQDRKEKELGKWNMENFLEGLEAFSLELFLDGLGWSPEALEVFLSEIRTDVKASKGHPAVPLRIIYGRKSVDVMKSPRSPTVDS